LSSFSSFQTQEGNGSSRHRLFHCNKTKKEYDDDAMRRRFLLLKHKEEGDDNKLSSPSTLQHNQNEEGNDNLLVSPSLLQLNQQRRRQQLLTIAFFIAIEPKKKGMAACRHCFLCCNKTKKRRL
jgi:hypothetical protein